MTSTKVKIRATRELRTGMAVLGAEFLVEGTPGPPAEPTP